MKKQILSLMLTGLVIGCGARLQPIAPSHEKIDSFNIGQVQDKTVGEPMLYDLNATFLPGFVAVKDYQIPSGFMIQYPPIRAGLDCIVVGSLENGDYACSLTDKPIVYGSGRVQWHYCLVMDKNGNPYGDTACHTIAVRQWDDKPLNLFKSKMIFLEGSLRRELLYNGRSRDMIKFQYREFNHDLARPAFYQDLIYDLSESRTIGFKGMIIDVIDASNSSIKFIVRSGMNN